MWVRCSIHTNVLFCTVSGIRMNRDSEGTFRIDISVSRDVSAIHFVSFGSGKKIHFSIILEKMDFLKMMRILIF